MKNVVQLVVVTIFVLFDSLFAQEVFIGTWQGKLALSGQELRIVFHISQDERGVFKATMDSPDQGARGIGIDEIQIDALRIVLSIKAIGGSYEATLQEEGQGLKGIWKQSGYAFPLDLQRAEPEKIEQPKKKTVSLPYGFRELSIVNPVQGNTIAGTLTFPKDKKSHPALILISGSGAQDRDETILGHKPFFVLADYLTRRGFAVFRYDDRGVSGSTGNLSVSTIRDLSADVQTIVTRLKKLKEIDKTKIGLLGHSEGGLVASLSAANDPSVAFIVLMASPGLIGSEIICDQVGDISRMAGLNEQTALQNMEKQRNILDIVMQEKNNALAEKRLKEILPPAKFPQIKLLLSPKYRSLISFDPAPVLMRVICPVLALNGGKDIQVKAKKNLKAIAAALQKGGNKNVRIKEIPKVNHLFQTAQTGAVSEYGKIKETINADILKIIGDWLEEKTEFNVAR